MQLVTHKARVRRHGFCSRILLLLLAKCCCSFSLFSFSLSVFIPILCSRWRSSGPRKNCRFEEKRKKEKLHENSMVNRKNTSRDSVETERRWMGDDGDGGSFGSIREIFSFSSSFWCIVEKRAVIPVSRFLISFFFLNWNFFLLLLTRAVKIDASSISRYIFFLSLPINRFDSKNCES